MKIVESKYFEWDSNMVSFLKYPHVFGFIKRIFKNCKLCVSYPWHCLSYHFISRPVGGVWDKISAPSHYHFLSSDWSASNNNGSDWLVKNFLQLLLVEADPSLRWQNGQKLIMHFSKYKARIYRLRRHTRGYFLMDG